MRHAACLWASGKTSRRSRSWADTKSRDGETMGMPLGGKTGDRYCGAQAAHSTMVFAPITWEKVCADPQLQELPYRIELNRFNQIVMSPVNPRHSELCYAVARRLEDFAVGGRILIDLAVDTSDRIKVPDVAWATRGLVRRMPKDAPWTQAPDLCIEVLSPSNTKEEMRRKRVLFFERDAKEVWICDQEGRLTFFRRDDAEPEGQRSSRSQLLPGFPTRVRVKPA